MRIVGAGCVSVLIGAKQPTQARFSARDRQRGVFESEVQEGESVGSAEVAAYARIGIW